MHIVAATQPSGPMHLHTVADNLLEALAVIACTAPGLFPALMGSSSEDTEGRLLDRWVAIASTRSVIESGGAICNRFECTGLPQQWTVVNFARGVLVALIVQDFAICLSTF